jgi:TPR repeat protein
LKGKNEMRMILTIRNYAIFGLLLITLSGCNTDSSETTSVPAGNKLETKQGKTASQSPQDLYKLGKRYVNGEDVPQDTNKGIQLILEAAEQGYAEAQHAIGVACIAGKEEKEAVKWLRKAVDQEHLPAISLLGAYLLGKKEYGQEGNILLSRAAALGDKNAGKLLREYEQIERENSLLGY